MVLQNIDFNENRPETHCNELQRHYRVAYSEAVTIISHRLCIVEYNTVVQLPSHGITSNRTANLQLVQTLTETFRHSAAVCTPKHRHFSRYTVKKTAHLSPYIHYTILLNSDHYAFPH